jgi:hypothetical protein
MVTSSSFSTNATMARRCSCSRTASRWRSRDPTCSRNFAPWLGGRSTLGDPDANRVDRSAEETDPESPYTYEQVDEVVAPIIDPTDDGETQYDNPAMASVAGPIDGGLYEARRLIPWERREEDPDPTATDPTDPAYIELPEKMRQEGALPSYIPWINTTEQVAKWWRDGAPEVIFP